MFLNLEGSVFKLRHRLHLDVVDVASLEVGGRVAPAVRSRPDIELGSSRV